MITSSSSCCLPIIASFPRDHIIAMSLRLLLSLTALLFFYSCSLVTAQGFFFYPAEMEALFRLRDSMSSAANLPKLWNGPPCDGNVTRWSGVACSNGHVVRLVLEGIRLAGSLPPGFLQNITLLTKLSLRNNSVSGPLPSLDNLLQLEHVFLSRNRFTGSIPRSFIQVPLLKMIELQENDLSGEIPPFGQPGLLAFNVSFNNLEGQIPMTDVLQRFPEASYDHNPGLCGAPLAKQCLFPPVAPPAPGPSPGKDRDLLLWLIALAAAAVLVPFFAILVFLCWYKNFRKERTSHPTQPRMVPSTVSIGAAGKQMHDPEKRVELAIFDRNMPAFALEDLLRASAEMLGRGKLGTTYKATMESGVLVAVKRLRDMNGLSEKEFVRQMNLLGNIRHENLARILSFYYSREEKFIVYEFVPNGDLFQLLHEGRGGSRVPLTWATRLSIIKDTANGMNFLHQHLPSQRVSHSNLKSSNVLTCIENGQHRCKLTDFGYLPLLPSKVASERLAISQSPEFSQGKKLTHKTDVYCFGLLLLEIATGRVPQENVDPSGWARELVNSNLSAEILDVELVATREGHDEMLKMIELALECADMLPERRPTMSEVLDRIQEIQPYDTRLALASADVRAERSSRPRMRQGLDKIQEIQPAEDGT